MKYLFTHGADPHIITETSGQSLLHWAAREGRVDLLDIILDYSTDVDIKDKFGIIRRSGEIVFLFFFLQSLFL